MTLEQVEVPVRILAELAIILFAVWHVRRV
jgi:flagellar biogenesis protein FliO